MSTRRPGRRPTPTITPVQVLVIVVVVGIFIAAVVIGGWTGAVVLGLIGLAAGALLLARWAVVDPRIRVIRLVAVLATLAVAVSLAVRA